MDYYGFKDYIEAELLVLVPVLFIFGYFFKKARFILDESIPLMLGALGIALSLLWVMATIEMVTWQDRYLAAFTAVVQGVLAAGAAVYLHQVYKQLFGKPP